MRINSIEAMNILHISDFHYNGDRRILDKFLPTLLSTVKNSGKHVDYVLFTGDLVDKGNVVRHFDEAKCALFDSICKELNVSIENVIFCPGNHDIDYMEIRHVLDTHFRDKIKSNEDLDNLVSGKSIDRYIYPDSIKPLQNYRCFLNSIHPEDENNVNKDLYSIHYRVYNGLKIAFVCLYSSWLCNLDASGGKNDYGNLYFPKHVLDEISLQIPSDVSRKILLVHHPISFLKDFNSYEIENEVYDNYDMMFVGHIHKMANVTRHNGVNGIYEHTSKASLTKKDLLGCSFIENDDIEDNRFLVSEITYIRDSNECHFGTPLTVTIPVGQDREERNRLRKKVYEKIAIEKREADNLLLIKSDDGGQDFLNSYNTPLIKKTKDDSATQLSSASISMSDIYSSQSNLIILGKDKCGKTSLLRRVQLEYLMNYTTYDRAPFYIDAKEEESRVDDTYSFDDRVRSYFGLNKRMADELISSDQFVLLVDNYKPSTAFSNYLESFMQNHPHTLMFAVGEDLISMDFEISNLNFGSTRTTEVYYFRDLRKREIIQYTDKQLACEGNKIQIQEKILKLCKQMELPYNYWTISLFLLIHHKSSDTYSKNLFSILDVCVDEIFGKKKLLLQKSRVTFEQLKRICAMLATYLFREHEDSIYSASEDQIIGFLSEEFKKQKRIVISPREAFNFFVACGMLKRCPNGLFVFRLNGFFEYFLAYQMTVDERFKNDILNNEKVYLGFKNQLEIYSGLNNSDTDFLRIVSEKTSAKCNPLFHSYGKDKDTELKNKMDIPRILEDKCKSISIKNALTSIQRAEIEELAEGPTQVNSDVHLVQEFDPTQANIDVVGRYLEILARVFKNIVFIDDEIVNSTELFRSIINYYCDFSYFIIENLSAQTEAELKKDFVENLEEFEPLNVLRMISNFSPLLAQMQLFDGLGHYSIERMAMDEIDNLKLDSDHNQYKLFILYFLLLDLSLDGREALMDEAISILKMPILRYMMNLKFNYYMAFRSDSNKGIQTILSDKIRKTKRLIDKSIDRDVLEINVSEVKKEAMKNKQIQG